MTIQPDTLLSRQHIRQQIRDRRRALSPEQQRLFAQQAAERMMAWPPVVLAHNVALFLSFDGELDTQPLERSIYMAWRKKSTPSELARAFAAIVRSQAEKHLSPSIL